MTLPLNQPAFKPVWEGYLADPFVWRYEKWYYATGTSREEAADGLGEAARPRLPEAPVFPLLRSPDLQSWTRLGNALARPDPALGNEYWAPEVACQGGRFYLYYSIGPQHQLRVATSSEPQGLYHDASAPLTQTPQTPFAIDASPFQDDDGQWYLFYARDFLDENSPQGYRAGTGLAVDTLADMTRLLGEEQVVARARFDWTLFARDRGIYNRTWPEWHTLEGAHVVRRGGAYYCFYSGACYGNDSYGVDYLTAPHPLGPWDDSGSAQGPRVLRSIPGLLRGPGHCSVVTDPNGADYLVFHAWNQALTRRQMHIAPLVWTAEGPRVNLRLPVPV